MTELQRDLAEEIAEDHADGIITRREAMRRLGLPGVTKPPPARCCCSETR
jgi:carboxymethylenebutenolidase